MDRLLKDYKVSARIGKPQVAFRETPSSSWQGSGEFDQEIQGNRHFAKISIKIEPVERGKGFVFEKGKFNKSPVEILTAVEKGLKQALSSGPLMAYPVKDLKVSLLNVEYKEEDLSLLAHSILLLPNLH